MPVHHRPHRHTRCRHTYAFVHNLISQVLPACPELRGQTVYELVTSVGATRECRSLAELRAAGIRAGVHAGRCPVLRKECETLVGGGGHAALCCGSGQVAAGGTAQTR